jgi:hypothetical protein
VSWRSSFVEARSAGSLNNPSFSLPKEAAKSYRSEEGALIEGSQDVAFSG